MTVPGRIDRTAGGLLRSAPARGELSGPKIRADANARVQFTLNGGTMALSFDPMEGEGTGIVQKKDDDPASLSIPI